MSVQAILGSLGLVLILCWFSNSFPLLSKVLCHRVEPQIHGTMWDSPYPPRFLCSCWLGPGPWLWELGIKCPLCLCEDLNSAP